MRNTKKYFHSKNKNENEAANWMNEWIEWMNEWLNDWMNDWMNDWIEWMKVKWNEIKPPLRLDKPCSACSIFSDKSPIWPAV